MPKKIHLTPQDIALFRQVTEGVRPLTQDKLFLRPPHRRARQMAIKQAKEQTDSGHYFSDHYQPYLACDGPTRYLRQDVSPFELKKLRRGDYQPELFLDLHGLTQQQAKQELAALLVACRQQHILCACVMHGYGKHILKQQTPLWLAQHPHILAFHQAPKLWGGDAALLLLLETDQHRDDNQ